jgi:filamentous hemagglutinin family protein
MLPLRLWYATGLLAPWLCMATPLPSQAQLIPDASLGIEASTITPGVEVRGGLADLVEGGATRGSNLFHSFLEFNIDLGQRLYFANPAGIDAILTRVTGGNPSTFSGTLGVDGAANLFLINPNGLVFSETARLDIQGSFYASTAAAIPLGTGVYSATEPEQSSLLTVNPSALFSSHLNDASGDIQNRGQLAAQGDLTLAANNLDLQGQVAAGGDLTLLGLDTVQIRDGVDAPFVGFAGGALLVQGNEAVDIVALSHADSGLYSYGDMVLRSANPVAGDGHYWSGGSFRVETLDHSLGELFSPIDPVIRALGDVELFGYLGGSLHILAGGSVDIGTAIITDADPGELGIDFLRETITLSDGTVVEIDGGAQPTLDLRAGVAPEAIGLVPPGNITGLDPAFILLGLDATTVPTNGDITVGDVLMAVPNGLVLLTTQYQPNTNLASGSIFITGEGLGGIGIDARGFGELGRSVYLDARNDVVVTNSSIQTSGAGAVGDVVINAGKTVRFDGQNGFTGAGSNLAAGAEGTGGNVRITATDVEVLNGTLLRASTLGSGDAGNVEITARDRVVFDNGSIVFSNVFAGATGNGGNVVINANTLEVLNGSLLSASTFGNGDAGNVEITARDRVVFDNGSSVLSHVQSGATGNGGNVVINANTLEVLNGSLLSASTFGNGDAGNVEITARDRVMFDNGSAAFSDVQLEATGDGGNVVINANILEVLNDSFLSGSVFGNGRAGNVEITTLDRIIFDTDSAAFSNVISDAVGQAGTLEITTGSLILSGGAQLNTGTEGVGNAGDVAIYVNSLEMTDGAQVNTGTSGIGNGGNAVIVARDYVLMDGVSSFNQLPTAIVSQVGSGAVGSGGNIIISTGNLTITQEARLTTSVFGSGNAGNIIVEARNHTVFDDGYAFSSIELSGQGTGGNIDIETGSLEAINNAQLSTSTLGIGDAGNILIQARDYIVFDQASLALSTVESTAQGNGGDLEIFTPSLEVLNGSQIRSNTEGVGNAGNILIHARDHVIFNGTGTLPGSASSASSSVQLGATGTGGNVEITTDTLEVTSGAVLTASTLGIGDAGNIVITARGLALLDAGFAFSSVEPGATGSGGSILIQSGGLALANGSQLQSRTAGLGDAGQVIINVQGPMSLQGLGSESGSPSGIFSDNTDAVMGQSNRIEITAPSLLVQDGAVILASTRNEQPGGDITLDLGQLVVLNGGQVVTGSLGAGPAGTIRINATDGIVIAGSDPTFESRVELIPDLRDFVIPQSAISVQASGSGAAGNIVIGNLGTTPRLDLNDRGRIIAESAVGDGGNIVINLNDLLLLRNGSLISTTAGTAQAGGDGGNITITVPFIIAVREEDSDIAADAFTGTGGNVTINARGIFGIEPRPQRTRFSDITASSELGVSGVVILNTLDTSFVEGLSSLADTVIDTAALTAGSCIARADDSLGDFVVTGSGGLPQRPGDSGISAYPTGTVRTLTEPTATLQEPDGIYQLPDGRLVLSHACE